VRRPPDLQENKAGQKGGREGKGDPALATQAVQNNNTKQEKKKLVKCATRKSMEETIPGELGGGREE